MKFIYRNRITKLLLLLLISANTVCSQKTNAPSPQAANGDSRPKVKVTYIANEGVLIATENRQILIDGLHRKYRDAYAFPPDELRELLENARAPYDKLDLLLVSHKHLDHFHSESIGNYLVNNPASTLKTSGQVITEIKNDFADYKKISSQISETYYERGKAIEFAISGIKVKFLGLKHANERHESINNFGHLVTADGKKFLHIGDADMTTENFAPFKLNEENIDVAFIPYWFLLSEEGRELVKTQFDPKHIIAVHVSPADSESVSKELKKHYSEITVFTKILETKTF